MQRTNIKPIHLAESCQSEGQARIISCAPELPTVSGLLADVTLVIEWLGETFQVRNLPPRDVLDWKAVQRHLLVQHSIVAIHVGGVAWQRELSAVLGRKAVRHD